MVAEISKENTMKKFYLIQSDMARDFEQGAGVYVQQHPAGHDERTLGVFDSEEAAHAALDQDHLRRCDENHWNGHQWIPCRHRAHNKV